MYFGRVADAPPGEAALQEYLNNTDDLHAGRTPQRDKEALTVRELCNRFLNSKRIELDAGKLSSMNGCSHKKPTMVPGRMYCRLHGRADEHNLTMTPG